MFTSVNLWDVCPLNVSDIRSLDFVINRFFMKLFNTNVINTVKYCQDQFGFELPSVLIVKRRDKFLARYKQFEVDHSCFILWLTDDIICNVYVNYLNYVLVSYFSQTLFVFILFFFCICLPVLVNKDFHKQLTQGRLVSSCMWSMWMKIPSRENS